MKEIILIVMLITAQGEAEIKSYTTPNMESCQNIKTKFYKESVNSHWQLRCVPKSLTENPEVIDMMFGSFKAVSM